MYVNVFQTTSSKRKAERDQLESDLNESTQDTKGVNTFKKQNFTLKPKFQFPIKFFHECVCALLNFKIHYLFPQKTCVG